MTEKLNNELEAECVESVPNLQDPSSEEKLQALSAKINEADKRNEGRKDKIERLTLFSEMNKERRIDQAREIMDENSERAKAAAIERAAILEYGSEYRRTLIARENKRALIEKALRDEREREEQLARESERISEIEAFKEREREELEKRTQRVQMMLEGLNGVISREKTAKDEAVSAADNEDFEEAAPSQPAIAEEPETDEAAVQFAATEEPKAEEAEIIETAEEKTEENVNTTEPVSNYQGDSERIILNIDPTVTGSCAAGMSDDNVIYIPQSYCMPQNAIYDLQIGTFSAGSDTKQKTEQPVRRHPELAFESDYRDYYRGADELYNRELVDEYEKFLGGREQTLAAEADNLDAAAEYNAALLKDARLEYEAKLSRDARVEYEAALSMDERLEYEAMLSRYAQSKNEPAAYEGNSLEFNTFGAVVGNSDISIGMDRKSLPEEDIGIFAKTELSRRLSAYHKQEGILKGKLKKIENKRKNLSYADRVRLTVDKINVHKEIVEVAIDALQASVYAKSKANISKHRKFLEKEILQYNSALGEYNTLTGRHLAKISPAIAKDVIEGRICEPIPNVYHVDDPHDRPEPSSPYEGSITQAQNRFNDDVRSLGFEGNTVDADFDYERSREDEKAFSKEHSRRIAEIRQISERDVLLVALRNEYKLSRYEAEYHMLQHSFSANNKNKIKRMRKLDNKISKIRSSLKRSIRIERDDNRRYYYLFTVDPAKEPIRSDANREELDALRLRLEILLSERREINERIIALYGGSDKSLGKLKIERKAAGVRRKYTKMMYKRQQKTAIKVGRMKAPEDLKEKFFTLLNKKTEKVASLEEKIYKLKRGKYRGRARRELERDVKGARRAIKYVDSDMKYLMKKLRRHQERYEDDRSWAITLICFSIIAVACVLGWYFFGDAVKAYALDIWERLKARF